MWRERKNIDNIMEVCRLCLGTDNLISVFDDRIKIPENIIDVIQITSGVTITADDNISTKLCNKCLHITIKMFKFRSSSIVNDIELKAMAASKLKTYMSRSVDQLLKKYPRIKLPSSITECNISPIVEINKNEITSWLEECKQKRKMEKRRRKEIRAAKKLVELEKKNIMDRDVENEIKPHIIPNTEILTETPSIKSSEPVLSTSKVEIPGTSSAIPDVIEVDEDKRQSHQEIIVLDIDTEESCTSNELDNSCKRKSSFSSNSTKPKKQKTNLDPLECADPIDSLVTVKYVNKSLLICDICNGILYSAKDLKKHKMNHMRCTLCRKVFRSMKETNEHSEGGCSIKQIMSNLPTINLKRCDESEEILEKYPWAFGNKSDRILEKEILNPVIPTESPVEKEEAIKDTPKEEKIVPTPQSKSDSEPIEVLLISDDEDEEEKSLVEKDNSVSVKSSDQTSKNTLYDKNQLSTSKNEIHISNKDAPKTLNDKKCITKPVELNTSSSTIKPNIEIVGENIIDVNLDDNDISLLKNLLKKTKHNIKETGVQTDMPCNTDISPSVNKDKLFELKNLRDYLNFYKIPVNISYASQYSVRYGNDPSPLLKKDRSWSKVNTKVPLKGITLQTPKPVENSHSKALPMNISTPVTISSTVGISAQLPLLVEKVQNGMSNVVTSVMPINSIHAVSGPIQNKLVSTKGPSITSANPCSVYGTTYSLTPTLTSSNSPIILNYNLQNVYSNASPTNSILAQTLSSQMQPQKFTIIDNNVNKMPIVIPSTSNNNVNKIPITIPSTCNNNVNKIPITIHSTCNNNVNKIPITIPSTSNNNVNKMPIAIPSTSKLHNTIPQSVNKSIPPLKVLNTASSPGVVSTVPVANNMPPPSSTFIPHRTLLPKPNPNPTIQIYAPPSNSNNQNSMMLSSSSARNESSNFVPTIRVRSVSELR